jgi:hypothetical protein
MSISHFAQKVNRVMTKFFGKNFIDFRLQVMIFFMRLKPFLAAVKIAQTQPKDMFER